MMLATIQEMVLVWVVPHGTYLEMRGKWQNHLETEEKAMIPGLAIVWTMDDIITKD